MQSVVTIRPTSGLPLCLAGITRHHHLSLSKQIADHDRIRNEMKRAKTEIGNPTPADEINSEVSEIEGVIRSSDQVTFNPDDDDDRDHGLRCAAKAA